jgi:hypothetical protein
MALDTTRAKAEIDTLATVHAAAVRERDAAITGLRTERVQLLERIAVLEQQAAARTLWGSSVELRGQPFPEALARVEAALGRLDTVRYFRSGTAGPLWTTDLEQLGGRGIVYSAKSPPATVLAGGHDALWRNWFARARAYLDKHPAAVVDWTSWHEPEDDAERGAFTPGQWRDALTRLATLQRDEYPHPRLRCDQILMGWTLHPGSKRTLSEWLVPEADVWAWDTYVGMAVREVAGAVNPAAVLAEKHGKPWAVAETGVSVALPDRPGLLTQLARRFTEVGPAPVYVTYFSSDPGGPSEYAWPIDNDPAAARAWRAGRGALA